MKVILLTELKGKGGEGDIVEVAPGFFNNYLGPQKMAVLATKGNIKQLEQRKGNIAKREAARIADAEAFKASLESKNVFVAAKVGEEGQLFGSVTTAMIADAIKAELDIDVDKKRIELHRAIKTAGEHQVVIAAYRDIKAYLAITVGEAKAVEEPAAEEVVEAVEETEAAAE